MKASTLSKGMMCIFILLLATTSFAQQGMRWRGSGGWGPSSTYSRMYNPKTTETIRGEVVSVDTMTLGKGMSYGVHVVMKADKETIPVHLGPAWYVENQDVQIQPRDVILVQGSRISFQGKPALIAAEVQKGDEILKLRDSLGFPAWTGWRRP